MKAKPTLSFWQIWNMCFGFLGIQFGFALQNANASRIFQTLGAQVDDVPGLWIAAPLTGLIVQPIIGYLSDRTWTGWGRRRPYFMIGAVFTTLALLVMPNAPVLWIAAGTLWVLDASINISMEPFRALVGDQLPAEQRPSGYAMQSFFIGVGAIVASFLPWLLTRWGVDNTAPAGELPDSVRYAFYLGAAVLFLSISWTVLRTREYSPAELAAFEPAPAPAAAQLAATDQPSLQASVLWCLGGLLLAAAIAWQHGDRMLYVLAGLCVAYGVLLAFARVLPRGGMLVAIMHDLRHMPQTMRRLAWVQFFSWFALFAMWIYTTAAVTQVHFGARDTVSAAYNDGANWVGVLFGAYNGFAALAAIVIPLMVRAIGLRWSHLCNLWLGAAGLLSMLVIRDPYWLLLSMLGVGFAWASILSLPYALLSDSVPAAKMGVYMGIFNFFIVIPQLVAASALGFVLRVWLGGQPIYALAIGGLSLIVAGVCVVRVPSAQGGQ
ncbi:MULTISPECIES: MFS transporter [Xanthomonas]|uniref:Sucrose/maltose H+ symporter n=1 Tax=Xanthomonas campestris pv. campestris (strain B100) TaxID=509169 RepID=B0RRG6_XANCB|nr:MFS transporter [Xanthomonas campestris]MCC3254787.1 MFS transporter [Xanthomonas campestris pv. armoraciae]MCC5044325.1 MFS transporter [Xanthomonas campestris]MCD0249549.1 MFS transporter [Xanthomonas campestris pv. campestris]MCD0252803.1 MFS transporter [Xanthomonas campestris pv. campestris]MCD0262314.1 MFS transporter [Xanthomonas campestris pv. campestris]